MIHDGEIERNRLAVPVRRQANALVYTVSL